jgi:hypothetical protein
MKFLPLVVLLTGATALAAPAAPAQPLMVSAAKTKPSNAWQDYPTRLVGSLPDYAKGMDSGFANTTGAGWVVKTQADRGRFYQNFTLGLLESGGCVGWHWFKYRDNDPTSKTADPSNLDSNKGIVNLRLEPYAPLLQAMHELNRQVYALAAFFDRRAK